MYLDEESKIVKERALFLLAFLDLLFGEVQRERTHVLLEAFCEVFERDFA